MTLIVETICKVSSAELPLTKAVYSISGESKALTHTALYSSFVGYLIGYIILRRCASFAEKPNFS